MNTLTIDFKKISEDLTIEEKYFINAFLSHPLKEKFTEWYKIKTTSDLIGFAIISAPRHIDRYFDYVHQVTSQVINREDAKKTKYDYEYFLTKYERNLAQFNITFNQQNCSSNNRKKLQAAFRTEMLGVHVTQFLNRENLKQCVHSTDLVGNIICQICKV